MLDEAVAKYNETIAGMHCFDPGECQMCAEDKVALDAAVRDVTLAYGGLFPRPHSQDCHCGKCIAWENAHTKIRELLGSGKGEG